MEHFISLSCGGEVCGMCCREGLRTPATHKVGEEILHDAPAALARTHNLTQYVCCRHFGAIVRPESAQRFRGCPLAITEVAL